MKRIALFAAMLLCGSIAAAQDQDGVIYDRLDSVVVSVSRAGERTPVTYSSFGRKELQSSNPMNSLPMSLSLLPSVVTYNEGGTGLGNSAMTIRGSKGSQINVTLNGITLNDSESQEVFWVNIPSLSALLSNVQVQRGLGTSANGAGAFGASINMNTAFVGVEPSARLEFSGGSYNTFITTLSSSSGISEKGFYGSAAYSRGTTDGYIRNAFVRSQSAFVALGWLSGKNSLRLTYLMGDQHSGITWDGISLEQYAADRRYNGAGEYYDEFGNVCYYPNQSDNYSQHHLQLNYSRQFSDALSWTNTINYTRGDGYDEYYKTGRKLERFGFASPVTGTDGNPYTKSDLIYRKKMDNDYWVLGSSLKYRSGALSASAGVNLSDYRGAHWGENLFAKVLGEGFDYSSLDWYRNDGHKREASLFARAEYLITPSLNVYADLQGRLIGYSFTGKDDDWLEMGSNPADIIDYGNRWTFFNPRGGISWNSGPHRSYASVAVGHREPGRSDIKENIKGGVSPISPEKMLDFELGYSYTGRAFSASANIYMMEYRDMLLETGRLSDSGYAIKENTDRAWRRGVELAAAYTPSRWVRLDGNLTLSVNQISDYTSFIPFDDYSGMHEVHYGRTTMLMSPSVTGMARLQAIPWKGGSLSIDAKYVGKQYIDNSMREEMAIPAWWVSSLGVSQSFTFTGKEVTMALYVNNLFNRDYYASGWRWESFDPATGKISYGIGVYPQAPRNFVLKLAVSF